MLEEPFIPWMTGLIAGFLHRSKHFLNVPSLSSQRCTKEAFLFSESFAQEMQLTSCLQETRNARTKNAKTRRTQICHVCLRAFGGSFTAPDGSGNHTHLELIVISSIRPSQRLLVSFQRVDARVGLSARPGAFTGDARTALSLCRTDLCRCQPLLTNEVPSNRF